ncbi:MAG TPA: helix-turn-helix domain-containing protein [Victivallales bacterium]|nr:helix-turn-helix domain-containing protein [Victivallales bacterium]HRU01038.1 helix-turn-helix domain-containing protein [Victivallales bacterium]
MNNIEELKEVLEKIFCFLEQLTGMRVTVNDIYGFFCDHEGKTVLDPDRIYHRLDYCQKADRKRCIEHECKHANIIAAKKSFPFIWSCWKGPQQIAVPLKWHGRHAGIIFIGPFISSSSNKEMLKEEILLNVPVIDLDKLNGIFELLDVIGRGIVEKAVEVKISGKGERWQKIYKLYTENITKKITIKDVAKELNLSPSRASHIVKELFGKSFEQLVLDYRIQRVAALLESTDMSISEIAEECGFCDIFYCSRVFKEKYGVSPNNFKQKHFIRQQQRK